MGSYSIIDWYGRSKVRPKMAVLPPRYVQFWLHRAELLESYVTVYGGGAYLMTAPIEEAIVNDRHANWVMARVEIPWAALLPVSDDFEEIELSCYFGKSGFPIGTCSLPLPIALRSPHLERVRTRTSYAHCGLSYVFADGTDVTVAGWAVARDSHARPAVRLAGRQAQVQKTRSTFAGKRYWFLPGSEWFGFQATASLSACPDWLEVDVATGGTEDSERYAVWHRLGSRDDLGPLPPDANIRRVSGDTANQSTYVSGGYTEFRTLLRIFARHGSRLEERSARVLDWGCGCARVTRHVMALECGKERTFGIDIDSGNIDWCKTNLHARNFSLVGLRPPTDLAAESFDAVFAVSVLSHLREADAAAWLPEIARIMRPGALAVLTYNGPQAAAANLATVPLMLSELEDRGFLDFRRSSSLDGFISDREYYRFVLFTDAHARAMFERHFEIVAVEPSCLAGGQNAAVLRKR